MIKLEDLSCSVLTLPKRNQGVISSKFKRTMLNSNYYKVNVESLSDLCIFAIKFMPEVVEEKKESVMKSILPEIKEFIENPIIKGGLIFSKTIPQQKDKTIINGEYIIMIREIQRFNVNKNPEKLMYFLGNVMRKVMDSLEYVEVSNTRKFINMKKSIEYKDLFIFSGFKLHFELLDNGYYLSVDTTKKIIRNQSVLEYINNLYRSNENLDRDEKRLMIKGNLINKIVMTNYGKTRYFRVEEVLFIDLTQVIVERYGITLPEYYVFKYNIVIKNVKQPLLFANSKKTCIKTYLIPELCLMTGIPEDFDEKNHQFITKSVRHECHDRKIVIDEFVEMMKSTEGDNVFPNLGIEISGKSEKFEAKLIPMPSIHLGGGKKVPVGRESSFAMHECPILKVKSKTKLGIITFDGISSEQIVHCFNQSFKTFGAPVEIYVLKAENNLKKGVNSIDELIEKIKTEHECSVCLILISNQMRHFYKMIKEICLIKKEISCQIVLEKTLKGKSIQSTALRIYLQILAKSGHTLWSAVPQARKEKIMLVAFSSCCYWKAKTKYFTIGICVTCDDEYTEIFSRVKKFSAEHEEMQCMRELILEGLNVYLKRNKFIPEEIIILENLKPTRSEAQSLEFFIEPFNLSMEEAYGMKKPKVTYILIRKTINNRFFQEFDGRYTNPPIGTLIDCHLTKSNLDFYMVAHNTSKTKGSLIPLNYKTVFSDSKIDEGIIYELLFSQCFSYANFAGAIKQPALVQNVTKCVKFVSDYLENGEVSEKLEMLPYYI